MKEGRKPEYPEKTLKTSFTKCLILKPENSSPTETQTRIVALVAGQENRCANHYTTRRPQGPHLIPVVKIKTTLYLRCESKGYIIFEMPG